MAMKIRSLTVDFEFETNWARADIIQIIKDNFSGAKSIHVNVIDATK